MAELFRDRVAVALLLVAGVLLLTNLDSGYLWQDEAETALLARRTLQFGYPCADDGVNAIDPSPFGYGPGQSWIYAPWLPFYLLAGVFALAGEATWIARLPFALLGWLCVGLLWRLGRQLTPDRLMPRLAMALLAGSVPFLLHMRQCRYYALTTALLLGVCLAYLAFLRTPNRQQSLLLTLVLALLFHTNFGTFLPTFAALIWHQGRWGGSERRRFLLVAGLVLLLVLPWVPVFYQPAFVGTFSPARLLEHLQYYGRITNKYLVPLVFMAAASLAWRLGRRRLPAPPPLPLDGRARRVLLCLVAAQVAFLLVPEQRHMRYLMPTFPLLLLGEAWWLTAWYRRHRASGSLVMVLLLFTGWLHTGRPQLLLADFAYELTHRYEGPMEGLVAYLRQHAAPGDVVKIPYDDRTLLFYTPLRVERPSAFLQDTDADWVVLRRGWTPKTFYAGAYYRRLQRDYERIELDAPDAYWQNREDPGEHHFRSPTWAPRVVLYRKRKPVHG